MIFFISFTAANSAAIGTGFWTSLNDIDAAGVYFWAGTGAPLTATFGATPNVYPWRLPTLAIPANPIGTANFCAYITATANGVFNWIDEACASPNRRVICELRSPCTLVL